MPVVSVLNQKGGVGKTTTVINLARSLNELGKKVLIIDLDAQMNATMGVDRRNKKHNINTCIRNKTTLKKALNSYKDGFDIVSSDIDFADIELHMFSQDRREYILKELIDPIKNKYDFVLLDCSPSLGIVSLNALVASDYILIPSEQSQFALDGIDNLFNFILRARKLNPNLKVLGVLLTLLDRRENITYSIKKELEVTFGEGLFDTFISKDSCIKKSQAKRKPLMDSYPDSRAKEQYFEIAKEVIDRAKKK